MTARLVAHASVSAAGRGREALAIAPPGEGVVCRVGHDASLASLGARRPRVARARLPEVSRDRAESLLDEALASLTGQLDELVPGWRGLRVGLVLGTSSGAMDSQVAALAAVGRGESPDRELARRAPYFGLFENAARAFAARSLRGVQVHAACASSTVALGLALRWLRAREVDLAVAGGFDAVSPFVAAGFESLGAVTADRPLPFHEERDGLALGEGACLVALLPGPGPALCHLRGFGMAADAHHATAPHPDGRGGALALRRALDDAGLEPATVGVVSPHGTATALNDAAERRAFASMGPWAARAHALKGVLGHTLGAAGALEAAALAEALAAELHPASVVAGPLERDLPFELAPASKSAPSEGAVSLSLAFGGACAALVLARTPGPEGGLEGRCGMEVLAASRHVESGDAERVARIRGGDPDVALSRLDPSTLLALTAVAELPLPAGRRRVGVVVGSAAASLEWNAAFGRRLAERGFRGVEPRRFPATSPNLPPGLVAQWLGLEGPVLAVGAGLDAAGEALEVAATLLGAGDADLVIALSVEHVGACVKALFPAAGLATPEAGAAAWLLGPGGRGRGPRVPELGAITGPRGLAEVGARLLRGPRA